MRHSLTTTPRFGAQTIVERVPEAQESGLAHLCEFIEDCEYPTLLTRVLYMLGDQGPATAHPGRYIRFIYNRLILEAPSVRAAAVSALAKFGTACPALRSSVLVLLRRALHDSDDEVRDRVVLYIGRLEGQDAASAASEGVPFSVPGLERALQSYLSTEENASAPFDIKTVPVDAEPAASKDDAFPGDDLMASSGQPVVPMRDVYAEQIAAVPELDGLGSLFKSSKPVNLTESETEYVVKVIKHVYASHVVFHFNVTLTLNDQIMENVTVELSGGEQEIDGDEIVIVAAEQIVYDKPADLYVAVPLDPKIVPQEFGACLNFIVKDCDPETGEVDEEGYEDSYDLDNFTISLKDYMVATDRPNFGAGWNAMERYVSSLLRTPVPPTTTSTGHTLQHLSHSPACRSPMTI